jgi:predicted transcriptional regulator
MEEKKTSIFYHRELTPEEQKITDRRMSNIAKALSNPTRIKILRFLARQKECFNGSLHEELGIPRATISQNLQMLKDVGLIHGKIEFPRIKYCINRENWDEARNMFAAFFADCIKEMDDPSCC